MIYRLSISRQVQQEIDRLPGKIRQQVRRAIAELVFDPRPATAKAMEGDLVRCYRIRLDDSASSIE